MKNDHCQLNWDHNLVSWANYPALSCAVPRNHKVFAGGTAEVDQVSMYIKTPH